MMQRREFLSNGIVAAATFITSPALAQQVPTLSRAAIVVGVNKAGNLPTLSAAAAGANLIASWLATEGFETKLFTDERGPVKTADLFDAIAEFVERGTLDQLVVYFSGHGFLNGFHEYWMLSGAPQNPNEAVSLTESVLLARECAIPHVVFISDACRSTPDSINASRVRGSLIFPNSAISRNVRPYVDQFLAALPGQPAAEIPVSQSTAKFEGLFTACLLSAFREPAETLVTSINGVRVLPNKNLKIYLESEVVRRAEAKSLRLHQKPDAQVVSLDTMYIAPVRTGPTTANTISLQPTIRDVALVELASAGADLTPRTSRSDYLARRPTLSDAEELGFSKVQESISRATFSTKGPLETLRFQNFTGFRVSGATVVEVVTGPNASAEIRRGSGSESALIEVRLQGVPAASVALRFHDGSGTILAALHGYICSVVLENGSVDSASYLDSRSPPDPEIDYLRTAVAAAAQFGVFRIDGEREAINRKALEFANKIRMGKSADPTLGLYAAYAYSQADLIERVRSVEQAMRGTLRVSLFDVAMLGRRLTSDRGRQDVFPFCPMLSQGWGLLRVTQTAIPPEIDRARDYLQPGLWTTLAPEGLRIAASALRNGIVR